MRSIIGKDRGIDRQYTASVVVSSVSSKFSSGGYIDVVRSVDAVCETNHGVRMHHFWALMESVKSLLTDIR